MKDWAALLRARERAYGGIDRVTRRKVSAHDPRGQAAAIPGSMLSGARFIPKRGYAEVYAAHLHARSGERLVIVELGVLKGVGLAVWCDIFPHARVIGLDVDLGNLNMADLRAKGAFAANSPAPHVFDELASDAPRRLARILRGEKIDVMIDDALHDDASILAAMAYTLPHMADRFLYFVEDNATVHRAIRREYPHLKVSSHDRLTVVSNG